MINMAHNYNMKNVLIVDDEKSFLLSLVEGLRPYASDFNTLTAENGKEAIEILESVEADLIVTDLKMPGMDGFELLAYVKKNHPDVPVIIITAYYTSEIKERLEALGSFKLLEKPLDFKELVDNIFAELATVSRGYIRGITLPAFLQLVEMEKKTCTIKVKSRGRTGHLYFNEGNLMDADNGTDRNEKAAYDIVCWDQAEIEISSFCKEMGRNISSSLNHILMEGFRIKDESERSKAKDPGSVQGADDEDLDSDLLKAEETDQDEKSTNPEDYEEEKRMATLKDLLNEFAKLQGVTTVCLVGRDGFLLDSIATIGIDTEMIGAIASSGFGASESMGRQLGKGTLSMTMIEFENGPVLFAPVGEDAFIVIIAEKDSNLGMVRLKLKKHCSEIANAAAI